MSYKIHHDSYHSLLETIEIYLKERNLKVNPDQWFADYICNAAPGYEETARNSIDIGLKSYLHTQIYRLQSGRYELNMYIL